MADNDLLITGEDSACRLVEGQKVLNRYLLQRVLGRGGMGVVWLARDEALDLDVALKFVPSLVINDRASLDELKRETRRNLALTHPNIVRTYDFVQGGTLAGISMEYVDADTLRNRRLDQPDGVFAPEALGAWTLQLCDALHYAHGTVSIVHRDLKPANLLINGRNQLKVADFGIARSLGESVTQMTGRNTSNGTLLYMSPQQLDGDPAHPLDDIYAIGATLYELCTSRPPFYSGELLRQIVMKTPTAMAARRAELGIPAGRLPQNWESTVAACLAKERAQRPQSANEIAVRLGLRLAAAVRNPTQPLPLKTGAALPIAQKIAVTPIKAAAVPVIPLPPSRPDWKARGQEIVERVRPHSRIVLAAAAGLLLVGLLAMFLLRGGKPSPEQAGASHGASAGAHGAIFVEAEPAGALVQVDGKPAEAVPFLGRDVAAGTHYVRVILEGYDDYEGRVEVKANQQADTGKIKLAAHSGKLAVTTNPPGMEVVIHGPPVLGADFHYKSPWDSGKLPVGEYEITAARPGWEPVVQRVSLTRGQAVPVAFDLTGGTVQINSVPPNATVLRDGQPVGVTPYVAQDVPPGDIKYSVALEGYGPSEVVGRVAQGQTLTLDAKLSSKAELAKLALAQAGAGGASGGEDADKSPEDKQASKTGRSAGEEDRRRRRTGSTKKKEPENEFLKQLKKIPLPFWRH